MFKGSAGSRLVLLKPREHLHEYFLRQILFGSAPGQMASHNADHQWVQTLDQNARRVLVAPPHLLEAPPPIELVGYHEAYIAGQSI
jgi:hypothetical protein